MTLAAPIRVLVVDDEPLARRNVTVLLRSDAEIESVLECGSGVEAIEIIRQWQPHLVFLDVQMPECGGFDVLELLGTQLPPAIIFVTAYDEYALRAFEVGALDYLLKPFDDARFHRALQRAKDKLALYAVGAVGQPTRRLVVRSPGQLLFLNVSDIDWIEAASYYACLHVGRDMHILRRTLSELEGDLGDGFIRIHRSIIVNVERIQGLELQNAGEYEVVLKSSVRLRLSRRFRKQLQDRMAAMSAAIR
ncbi:MAG TPA: LytTR family DNA-binding domain-containing protein [Steroidobacter sp.]